MTGNNLAELVCERLDAAAIDELRDLLDLATKNQLTSLVCSARRVDGATQMIYSTYDLHLAVGQLEEMKFTLLANANRQET